MMQILGALVALLISAQARTGPAQAPEFTFTVQTEKRVFKSGEPIWVVATLQNQSSSDIYVPHAMTSCSGLESQVHFSIVPVKRSDSMHGRGCGIGSGCGDCRPPASFEEHVRNSWVLLHPNEIFGARIDTSVDAPDTPGTYRLQAEYAPSKLATGDRSGPKSNQIRVIAQSYQAAPAAIIVHR